MYSNNDDDDDIFTFELKVKKPHAAPRAGCALQSTATYNKLQNKQSDEMSNTMMKKTQTMMLKSCKDKLREKLLKKNLG